MLGPKTYSHTSLSYSLTENRRLLFISNTVFFISLPGQGAESIQLWYSDSEFWRVKYKYYCLDRVSCQRMTQASYPVISINYVFNIQDIQYITSKDLNKEFKYIFCLNLVGLLSITQIEMFTFTAAAYMVKTDRNSTDSSHLLQWRTWEKNKGS